MLDPETKLELLREELRKELREVAQLDRQLNSLPNVAETAVCKTATKGYRSRLEYWLGAKRPWNN